MKHLQKTLISAITSIMLLGFSHAQVPAEYLPNYQFQDARKQVQDILIQLDASRRVGAPILPATFSELSQNFQRAFGYFPQDPNFKVVYQQCQASSQGLAQLPNFSGPNINALENFFSVCFDPLQEVIDEIANNFTVKPAISANPKQGAAPLTVTFDARTSSDPSNDTIPTNNFFRYYRDAQGNQQTIGRGSVLNYTFTKEGNYIVRLTVRSANNTEKGVFDGEGSVAINVGPQAAIIAVYVNGKKLREDLPTKIGSQEARRGIVIDGGPTLPRGGRTLISHTRTITSNQAYTFSQTNQGAPGSLTQILPNNGEFRIKLTVTDNENNSLTKEYVLVVSDPVALIKMNPEQATTANTITFDASSSYSVVSNIRLYTREFFDGTGNKIDTIQGKSIKKQFKNPGTYKVKLTVNDEQGQTNSDQIQFYVDSSDPLAQFSITPYSTWKAPSEFYLDASTTNDIDVNNNADTLNYERNVNTQNATIVTSGADGRRALVSFNDKGKYTITLTAKDRYGKIGTIDKEVDITSSLRPQILAVPLATTVGKTVTFIVKSNKPIINYERDFGNNVKRTVQTDRISITYSNVGTYTVTLKATSPSGEENEVTKNIYIGEKDAPVAAYQVKDGLDILLSPSDVCQEIVNGTTQQYSAYQVPRLRSFTLNPSDSVNVNGGKNNLKYYFQPKNDEIITKSILTYRFTDVGCQYIDMSVEDTVVNKIDKKRIWFNVTNALPVMENLTISFPQYGDDSGIGFNQNKIKDIYKIDYDPLVVRLNAQNSKDPDGFISFYTWYYYNKEDPSRLLEVKITPSSIPYAFFSLPRVAGEYAFGVKISDNDSGEVRSEEILGKGPVVFFPPDSKNIDIPITTLKVAPINAKVGDDVRFEVESKILSNRSDFNSTRTIKYDFDGDGIWDLTTKDDSVIFQYSKPGKYTPRAQVLYRGFPGRAIGETIDIKNGLKALTLSNSFDNKVLIRNVTIGDSKESDLCLDLRSCNSDMNMIKRNEDYTYFEYPSYGRFVTKFTVRDEYANESTIQQVFTLNKEPNTTFHLLTVPETVPSSNILNINVGKNLNNEVLMHPIYTEGGDCYIDKDISIDSNSDGNRDQDRDIPCNATTLVSYDPQFKTTIARAYYEKDKKLISKDYTINFLDFVSDLSPELLALSERLNAVIASLDPKNEKILFLKNELITLRNGIGDKVTTSSQIVTLTTYLETIKDQVSVSVLAELAEIFKQLSDSATSAALGGTSYENAKNGILFIIPETRKSEVQTIFQEIEGITGDKTKIKSYLENILAIVNEEIGKGTMQQDDLGLVRGYVCQIVNYYSVPSETCGNIDQSVQLPSESTSSTANTSRSVLKIVLIVLGVLAGGFIVLVVVFAVKARMQQNK